MVGSSGIAVCTTRPTRPARCSRWYTPTRKDTLPTSSTLATSWPSARPAARRLHRHSSLHWTAYASLTTTHPHHRSCYSGTVLASPSLSHKPVSRRSASEAQGRRHRDISCAQGVAVRGDAGSSEAVRKTRCLGAVFLSQLTIDQDSLGTNVHEKINQNGAFVFCRVGAERPWANYRGWMGKALDRAVVAVKQSSRL